MCLIFRINVGKYSSTMEHIRETMENDSVFYFQHGLPVTTRVASTWVTLFSRNASSDQPRSKGLDGTPWVLMKCITTMKLCGLSTVYLGS